MDSKKFYGTLTYVRDLPDGNQSECSDFSDDDTNDNFKNNTGGHILAPDSDSEEENNASQLINDVVVSESDLSFSDDEDMNMPLAELAEKLFPGTWKKGNLRRDPEEIKFTGQKPMPSEICNLDAPTDYFFFLFPKELINYITEQTNIYAFQTRPQKAANIRASEIEQFIGTSLYMSIVHLPQTRHYWSAGLGYPAVSKVITCNRWEEIKRFLHFNNNENQIPTGQPGHDKLFKIRPLIDKLRQRLLLVPREEHLAVDEQIIPTKARSSIKQYNPKKPHKWGYKNYVLSGISGFSYDFDIFAGAQSNTIAAGVPNLGVSSNVVVRLATSIPRHVNHKIFFDNWFSSVPLKVYLNNEGILSLGTVRINRVRGCKMPTDRELKKRGRGSMEEKVATINGTKISVVTWFDNKVVSTISTYVGSEPKSEKRRYFSSEKIHKMIPCPRSVLVYNDYMGGVDLLDAMLGYYRIQIRSKKWYLKIFFHLVDLCVVNAWLLWRRQNPDSYLPLMDFKISVADSLCKSGKALVKTRGRPSNEVQQQYERKRQRGAAEIPQKEVRKDGLDHHPDYRADMRNRCKFPGCDGKSYIYCLKCEVALCLNKDRNCFMRFHTE